MGRASASAIAAFLLVLDFVLILAIRPHRSLLTNIESAWVSFCLGNGFWSLTKHFDDRSGDDTPVSAVWHLIAVASSFLFEGCVIIAALNMRSPVFAKEDAIMMRQNELEEAARRYKWTPSASEGIDSECMPSEAENASECMPSEAENAADEAVFLEVDPLGAPSELDLPSHEAKKDHHVRLESSPKGLTIAIEDDASSDDEDVSR